MSHLYDTIEPNIINEALLRQCIVEQGPEGEAGRLAKIEGIDFAEVTSLRLDFQSVCVCERERGGGGWGESHLLLSSNRYSSY